MYSTRPITTRLRRSFPIARFPIGVTNNQSREIVNFSLSIHLNLPLPSCAIPRFEDEAFGAVFAVEAGFFFLEDAEGFAGEFFAVDVLGVEDVAEFFFGEAIELGAVGVELGA